MLKPRQEEEEEQEEEETEVPPDVLNPLLEKLMDQCCSTKDSSVDGGDKIVT